MHKITAHHGWRPDQHDGKRKRNLARLGQIAQFSGKIVGIHGLVMEQVS